MLRSTGTLSGHHAPMSDVSESLDSSTVRERDRLTYPTVTYRPGPRAKACSKRPIFASSRKIRPPQGHSIYPLKLNVNTPFVLLFTAWNPTGPDPEN